MTHHAQILRSYIPKGDGYNSRFADDLEAAAKQLDIRQSNKSMEIETKNASIDTFCVTINTLHVSGKQMTISVFRQIPEWNCFSDSGEEDDDENFTPNNTIKPGCKLWGKVNYKIENINKWIVFSEDGILYRSGLSAPMLSDYIQGREGRLDYIYDRRSFNQILEMTKGLMQLFIAV